MEEAFFEPCNRMRDLVRDWNVEHEHDEGEVEESPFPKDLYFKEVELRAGVGNGADDLFHHFDFTSDDLWDLASNKIVWISPNMFVVSPFDRDSLASSAHSIVCKRSGYGIPYLSVVSPSVDTGRHHRVLHVHSRSTTDATTTDCDSVFQWMTRSNANWTHLRINNLLSISTDTLARVLKNSRRGTIKFENECLSKLSQDQMLDYLGVFADSAGPLHRIELRSGTNWLRLQTVAVTLAEFLQHCQCAFVFYFQTTTQLPLHTVPSFILDALRGDCNIVEFQLDHVLNINGFVRALAENKSLVRLTFVGTRISDDSWAVLCQSLSRHPKLEYLRFDYKYSGGPDFLSYESKTRRTNAFLMMLQANTVLQELVVRWDIACPLYQFDERIFTDVIKPHFRHLRHVRAFGTYPNPGYDQLLARALCKVNDSPSLVWTLIRSSIPSIVGYGEDN
jgi:hypothetical protein